MKFFSLFFNYAIITQMTELAPSPTNLNQKRNQLIDIFRFIFSILIVFLHYFSNLSLTGFSRIFVGQFLIASRLGVPFFFIISGFYYFRKISNESTNRWHVCWNYIKKLLIPYLFWAILMLITHIILGVVKSNLVFLEAFNESIQALLVSYLWYIPVLIFIILIYTLCSYTNIKVASFILLGIGTLSFIALTTINYTLKILPENIIQIYNSKLFNGLFYRPFARGLFFFAIGAVLNFMLTSIKSLNNKLFAIILIITILFLYIENNLLYYYFEILEIPDSSFMLPVAVTMIFSCCVKYKYLNGKLKDFFKIASSLIYFSQYFTLMLFSYLSKYIPENYQILYGFASVISISIICSAMSLLITKINNKYLKMIV